MNFDFHNLYFLIVIHIFRIFVDFSVTEKDHFYLYNWSGTVTVECVVFLMLEMLMRIKGRAERRRKEKNYHLIMNWTSNTHIVSVESLSGNKNSFILLEEELWSQEVVWRYVFFFFCRHLSAYLDMWKIEKPPEGTSELFPIRSSDMFLLNYKKH